MLYALTPGDHYPQDMPKVQKWITATLSPVFVRNLQYSDNTRSAAKFLSFNIVGRLAVALPLPNTGGLRLLSGPGQVSVQYTQELNNYRQFDVSTFDYELQSYFLLARDILRITPDQMIANTMNFFVELDGEKKDKYDLFIDQVNQHMKVRMPYATTKQVHALATILQQQFPNKISETIYSTYIQGKNDEETRRHLQQFFSVTGFFQEAVDYRLDDMMSPKAQFRQDGLQALELPHTIMTIPGLKDSLVSFKIETAKAVLQYHEKQLEITFTGKLNNPALMVEPKEIDRSQKLGKLKWVKPNKPITKPVALRELQLIVSEKNVSIRCTTTEGGLYQLSEIAWPQ
jgi:hypothetical protein